MGRPLNDLGWFVYLALLSLVCWIVLTVADWVRADPPPSESASESVNLDSPMAMPAEFLEAETRTTAAVAFSTDYIRAFHESVCRGQAPGCVASIQATRRWQTAAELAAAIVAAAEAEDVPWAVLLVLTRYESSYKTDVVGGRGERGLAQVHGRAADGYDLATVEGQLSAGAAWYAHCRERCGGRDRALAAYQSGRCRATVPGARLRAREIAVVEDRYRAWEIMENEAGGGVNGAE